VNAERAARSVRVGAGLLAVLLAGCWSFGAGHADVGVTELPGRLAIDVVQQLVSFPFEPEPFLVYLAALAVLPYQVQRDHVRLAGQDAGYPLQSPVQA
jgi:hypothetical protein